MFKTCDVVPNVSADQQKNKQSKSDQFASLTEIQLTRVPLGDAMISGLKEILNHVQTVKLKFFDFDGQNKEFYENFLIFCDCAFRQEVIHLSLALIILDSKT